MGPSGGLSLVTGREEGRGEREEGEGRGKRGEGGRRGQAGSEHILTPICMTCMWLNAQGTRLL